MLKNIDSKQTSPNLAIGRSQSLLLGAVIALIGLLALSSWTSWLQTISQPQFAGDNPATLTSSVQFQNMATATVESYTPITDINGDFVLVADTAN